MRKRSVILSVLSLLWLLSASLDSQSRPSETANQENLPEVAVPTIDVGILQLERRAELQRQASATYDVRRDFRFTDHRPESGITFKHGITEDGGRRFKMVHYDHGNSVSAADVDGDGLSDLYFVSQTGSNELWHNLGDGRFENITESSGVGLADRISVAGSFADFDNDGDSDLFVTTVRMGNVLFENDGEGHFRDVTQRAGVGQVGHSSGAVFFDYDRDGLLDLFVTNVGTYTRADERGPGGYYLGLEDAFQGHLRPGREEQSWLYHNQGDGSFELANEATGLVTVAWSGDATFSDLDTDGFPELYVLSMQGDDEFWVNHRGKSFTQERARFFPKSPWGAMGVSFLDYDNDGRQDLMLTDMHSDMSVEVDPGGEYGKSIMMWDDHHLQGGDDNIFGNALWHNDGEPPFEEVSDELQAENYWPWGLSVGDLNADGWSDMFLTSSMSYPFRYGVNSLLLNERGEIFRHSEFLLGVEPRRDGLTRIETFVIDCSNEEDRSWPRHDRICGGRTGKQKVMGTVGTRSSVILDLEGDGDLDIVTGEFNYYPQVLISDLSQHQGVTSLSIRLVGKVSNRDGLGAKVEVTAGDLVQTRYHNGKSGYLAQSSLPLWFGLAGRKAEKVEVTWPSGRAQVVTRGLSEGGSGRSAVVIEEPDN